MYFSPEFAAGGPDLLRTIAATAGRLRLRVLRSYTDGAAYADVVAATVGVVAVTPGDITDAANPAAGVTLRTTMAAKSFTVSADDAGTSLHWALTDDTGSKVHVAAAAAVPSEKLPLRAGGTFVLPASTISRQVPA